METTQEMRRKVEGGQSISERFVQSQKLSRYLSRLHVLVFGHLM